MSRRDERERQAREYEALESLAMHDELNALADGDHEEAAFCDIAADVYRNGAERARRGA